MIYFFIGVQCVLLLFMALHDWIDIPPFSNLTVLRGQRSFRYRLIGSFVNSIFVLIPLIISIVYIASPLPLWARLLFVIIYGILTFGTLVSWWIPYFSGRYWMRSNKEGFEAYRNTHSFLPAIGKNIVPNTLHVMLHILIWICFGLALYWLISGGWNSLQIYS